MEEEAEKGFSQVWAVSPCLPLSLRDSIITLGIGRIP